MDLQQFAEKYAGVSIDFDNMYGAQCVDLARFYWQKVHGLNRPQQPDTTPSGGAKDLINNVRPPLRVRGKAEAPQPGDVVIWGATKGNPWGHVAVLLSVGNGHIEVFEQDGLNQGKGAQRKVWSMANISGYITMAA